MNKLGNFFVSIGKGIKKAFLAVVNWVKTTAWIQPLLIVGIIFGVILSIKPVTGWIGGLFNPDETYAFYTQRKIDIKNLNKVVDKDDKVIVIFYDDTDSTCAELEKTFRNFPTSGAKWYCVDVTHDNEDIVEDNKTAQEIFNDYFELNYRDLIEEVYASNITNYESLVVDAYENDLNLSDDSSSYQVPAPMMLRYENGTLIGVKPGFNDTAKARADIDNFVNGSTEDWETFDLETA